MDLRTTDEFFYVNDGSDDADLSVEYYKLTFAWMAEGTMNDLMRKKADRYQDLNSEPMDLHEVSVDGLDQVFVLTDRFSTVLFVRKEQQVMMIEYSGNRTEEELLDAVVEKIDILPSP